MSLWILVSLSGSLAMAVALQGTAGALAGVSGLTGGAPVCSSLPVFPDAPGLQYTPLTPFAPGLQQKMRQAEEIPKGAACLMVVSEALVCGRAVTDPAGEPELLHESTSLVQIKQLLPFAEWQKQQFAQGMQGVHMADRNSGVVFCRSAPSTIGDFHVTDVVQRMARSTAASRHKMFVGPSEVSLQSSVEAVFTAALCSAMDTGNETDPLPLLLLVPGCARDNYRATLARSVISANGEPVGFMSIASSAAVFREQQTMAEAQAAETNNVGGHATKLRLVLELGDTHVNASLVQVVHPSSSTEKAALSVRTLACVGTCEVGLDVCDMLKAGVDLKNMTEHEIAELSTSTKAQMLQKAKSVRDWSTIADCAGQHFDSSPSINVFDPLLLQRIVCRSLREVVRTSVQHCLDIAEVTSIAECHEIVVCTSASESHDARSEPSGQLLQFVAEALQGQYRFEAGEQQPPTNDDVAVHTCTFKDAFRGACLRLSRAIEISVVECLPASIGVCFRDRNVADEELAVKTCQQDVERIGGYVQWALMAGRAVPADEALFVPPAAAAAESNNSEGLHDLHLHTTAKLAMKAEPSASMDAEKGYSATCPQHGMCDLIVVQDGAPFSNAVDVLAIVKDPLRVPNEHAPPVPDLDGADDADKAEPNAPIDEAQVVAEYFDELLREDASQHEQPPEYAKLAKVEIGVSRGLTRAYVSERAVKPGTDHMFKWAVRVALIAMIVSAGLITAYNQGFMQAEQSKGMREALIDLYAKVNPDKVSLVDQLLAKNVGREAELLRRVKRKYDKIDVRDIPSNNDKWIPWEQRKKEANERLSEYRSKLYQSTDEHEATSPAPRSSRRTPSSM